MANNITIQAYRPGDLEALVALINEAEYERRVAGFFDTALLNK